MCPFEHFLFKFELVELNWMWVKISFNIYVVKPLNEQKCSEFGSEAKFKGSKDFFFFSDAFSTTAKILAHLHVS